MHNVSYAAVNSVFMSKLGQRRDQRRDKCLENKESLKQGDNKLVPEQLEGEHPCPSARPPPIIVRMYFSYVEVQIFKVTICTALIIICYKIPALISPLTVVKAALSARRRARH